MAYSTIPKGSLYMNTKLYTGNGSTNAQTGVGFQPDWTWIKCRSDANSHQLFDVLRTTYALASNETSPQADRASDGFTSLDSDGFTLNGSGSGGNVNVNSRTYASWNWKAGTSFTNDASSTGIGTIDSTGSTNTTSRFSIVKWTSTGSTGTVAHNLGVTPKFIVVKRLEDSGYDWVVYHVNDTAGLYLNSTAVNNDSSAATIFDRSPTSTVFNITADGRIGGNTTGKNYIAYCFADVTGFSKMGSYTGNGNVDGPMIVTGMKPAWFMLKRTDGTNSWQIFDNKRDTGNALDNALEANDSAAEATGTDRLDFLSQGVKLRTNGAAQNASGGTYIYMAFAENPFVATSGTSAIPVTAR